MTQVSNKPTERTRPREPREDVEPRATGGVPLELGRVFAQLFTDDGNASGAGASLSSKKASSDIAMIVALTEQLAPRVQLASHWPLQAVLYLPRLGRINASVRREQGGWAIELEAEQDATARWLSGVRQQCEGRLAGELGLAVSLRLPVVGCAC
ncbi:type III secretion system HrpP C-terminal domain-containing protein [Pseudomonas sp. 2995-1]|uniref:type III secretion system HrpP C-terminal domain-containing protein n=1 Tax=Pseudomonas TaxID=286 RepID=UPI000C15329F|nr:type III secretion system HrpP C-terminal domain-containing protein [Pseudomonas sp. 2995-1]PIB56039.1 type III secretion protein [Pseudomonas sp. 2995-1]